MRRGKTATTAAALLLALVVTGCASTSVNPAYTSPRYSRAMVDQAASSGGMPTIVRGRASASLNEPATAQVIIDRVRMPGWSQIRNLVPATADDKTRLVFIVNPAAVGGAMNAACGPLDEIPKTSGGNRIVVAGVFCDGGRTMTSNNGSVAVGNDAASALAELTQQLTLGLLPVENRMHPTGRVWDRWWP